jgi:2,3-bisphosphoglycerate-dependent phosphoglycerate mutase
MVSIIFEVHATTEDNENKVSSGWYDVQLSLSGRQEAKELGERYKNKVPDVVFCSDLGRSLQTAAIAFGGDPLFADPNLIFVDWRLRECNYGDFTGKDKEFMNKERFKRISKSFPNGESFEQANARMKSFLEDLKKRWNGKNVLIIGHRATHYGLETYASGKSLEQCLQESLTWKWQPGWEYKIK